MDLSSYIKIKRWNDPVEATDGWRLLICRYRPRALLKSNETWHTWWKVLGPSRELHAEAYGKYQQPISREEYKRKYSSEMKSEPAMAAIEFIRKYIMGRNTITLLCSSACVDPEKCHRSLLKKIILEDRK
jgi:uncharacterized protein YeaO (DUF488 family)